LQLKPFNPHAAERLGVALAALVADRQEAVLRIHAGRLGELAVREEPREPGPAFSTDWL
jgi:hypothetical protein